MKKILIPTDFSDCARAAEELGLKMAEKTGAEIHWLHIVHAPLEWVKLPLDREHLYPETKATIGHAREQLTRLSKEAEKLGLSSKEHLVYDRGREEIMTLVKKAGIDLIVMGSHGAEGLKVIIGSNAQMMVRYAPVPVLVVKQAAALPQKIVYASNFEEVAFDSFAKVKALASTLGAQLELLFVNTPYNFRETDEVMADMEAFCREAGAENCPKVIYNALNAERGIDKYAAYGKVDMVALNSPPKSALLRTIAPGMREAVVNHLKVPVLSINDA